MTKNTGSIPLKDDSDKQYELHIAGITMDDLYLTKQRLKGLIEDYQETPDIEDDGTEESDELLQAISSLSARIESIGSVNIDLTPITTLLHDVVVIQKQMAQKRMFKFKVTYNQSGDVSAIDATEV